MIIPIVQNYVFVWEVYANGTLAWDPWTYLRAIAKADPYWGRVLIGLLTLNALTAIALTVAVERYDTRLRGNPDGIMGIVDRIHGGDYSSLGFAANADDQSLSQLEESIHKSHYELVGHGNNQQLRLVSSPASHGIWVARLAKYRIFQHFRRILDTISWLVPQVVKDCAKKVRSWCSGHPHFFIFRPPIFGTWLAFVLFLAIYSYYLVSALNRNSDEGYYSYSITMPPQLFIIFAVLLQSIQDTVEESVRVLAPWDQLRRGYQGPHVLFQNFTDSGIPLFEILHVWWQGQYLLGSTILAGYATAAFTIFFGSLQLSSSSFGATSFFADQTAAVASAILITFVFGVNCCVQWRYCRGETWLTKPPDTMAAMVTNVIFSAKLREDAKAVEHLVTKREKVAALVKMDRRYAYGRCRENEKIGIERHEHWPDSMGPGHLGSTVVSQWEKQRVREQVRKSYRDLCTGMGAMCDDAWTKLKKVR
jgi:hypothetical protein